MGRWFAFVLLIYIDPSFSTLDSFEGERINCFSVLEREEGGFYLFAFLWKQFFSFLYSSIRIINSIRYYKF